MRTPSREMRSSMGASQDEDVPSFGETGMDLACGGCGGKLSQRWVTLNQLEVTHFLCETCGRVWLDEPKCRQLNVVIPAESIRDLTDFRCPRCVSKFLERVAPAPSMDVEMAQCRHCGGLLMNVMDGVLDQSIALADDAFGSFITDLALLRKLARQKLQRHQLPESFGVENARETDYKCPSCDAALTLYRVFDRTTRATADFEICDACFGIWLDKDDLVNKDGASRGSRLEVDFESITPSQKACPKCRDITLISMRFKSLDTVIDCCPSCLGTWLDGGELRQFSEHLNQYDYGVINTLVDNAVFRNPTLCRVLKHFSRALHDLDSQVQSQARNLEHAREIQEKLVFGQAGSEALCARRFGDYDVAQHWQPAREVGGDYFDLIPFDIDGIPFLGVCVADVSGKGLPASLLMANFQALLRSFAPKNPSPRDLCCQLNQVLFANTTPNKYITAVYGVLDLARHEFTFTNAGHEQPIHLGNDGTRFLKTGGTVLGLFPKWEFQQETILLNPGDRLILYTDGISEAGVSRGEAFEPDRLCHTAQQHRERSVKDLHAILVGTVKEFCANAFHDDATLLVLGR